MADATAQVAMTAEEWIAYYERHVGKKFRPMKCEKFLFHPEKGLMGYAFTEDGEALYVAHMIGDGEFWSEIARNYAVWCGKTKVRMETSRNPNAFVRRFGGKVTAHVVEFDVTEEKKKFKFKGGDAE